MGDAQAHGLRVVAVDAGDGIGVPGVVEHLVELFIGIGVGLCEAGHCIALPQLPLQGHDRGVAAAVAVGDGEGISEKHSLEPGVALDLLLGPRSCAR